MLQDKLPRDLLAGWNILVVDDEPDALEVVGRILRHFGATVHLASDGEEGLALAKKFKDELKFIISDLSMPVLDGWGLLFEVRNDPDTKHIPLVALTAHAMPGDQERALGAGFHNYITKPFTAESFMQDLVRLFIETPQPEKSGSKPTPEKPDLKPTPEAQAKPQPTAPPEKSNSKPQPEAQAKVPPKAQAEPLPKAAPSAAQPKPQVAELPKQKE